MDRNFLHNLHLQSRAKNEVFLRGSRDAVFELPGGGLKGLNLSPNCFLNLPNTLSNYVQGGQLYTVYIQFTSQFCSVSDLRKVQPPANFSQFKHCRDGSPDGVAVWPNVSSWMRDKSTSMSSISKSRNVSVQKFLLTHSLDERVRIEFGKITCQRPDTARRRRTGHPARTCATAWVPVMTTCHHCERSHRPTQRRARAAVPVTATAHHQRDSTSATSNSTQTPPTRAVRYAAHLAAPSSSLYELQYTASTNRINYKL